jgi:hypothetical protein
VVVLQTNVITMTVDSIEIRIELASRIYLSVLFKIFTALAPADVDLGVCTR